MNTEKQQKEMFFPHVLSSPKRAPQEVIDSFTCYRDAVLWCWENRVDTGLGEQTDQAIFARKYGVHAPHMSRYVSRKSKAPMKLDPDLIHAFQFYTGWSAISQWECKRDSLNPMEWVLEDRRAA